MEAKKIEYRLPQLSVLASGVFTLGLIYLIIFTPIYFFALGFLNIPIVFMSLSISACLLGSSGLSFSRKTYIEKVKCEIISNPTSVMFESFSFIIPSFFITLDENLVQGNIKYGLFFWMVYFLLFLYTSILIWYKKNYYYHVR